MPNITQDIMSTEEIYNALGNRDSSMAFIEAAYKDGQNLTNYLELQDPSEDRLKFDAVDRLMKHAGIITRSIPAAGLWASKAEMFTEGGPANRVLLTEFFARKWRQISFGNRATYLSGDEVAGSWARPYADFPTAEWDQKIEAAIPLSELIASITPITGQDFRAFFLTYDAEDLRMFRIGESAEIPIAKLETSERIVQLQKYGRGLEASYEFFRRIRVDELAFQIALMAVQSEVDKVSAGLDILVNGDGNAGTSPSTDDLTTLDTDATAGTLTVKGWIAYEMQFDQPYTLTHALMKKATALQLRLLNMGTANTPMTMVPLGGVANNLTSINAMSTGLRYGWTDDAPALQVVGYDRRFAMGLLTEIGGDISEMERFITNQTEIMTMTEVMGFWIRDGNATRILDVNA